MIKTVLFDLDGTLLPMDQDVFIGAYFKGLATFLAPHGYDPKALIDAVWAGTKAMIKNDGTKTNEKAFWQVFTSIFGEEALNDE
ncbi:MAG: HAD family hydrolase, partial [Clostridia bacterium]|nr:HAD family hydrolase [Clostridia bacterium]